MRSEGIEVRAKRASHLSYIIKIGKIDFSNFCPKEMLQFCNNYVTKMLQKNFLLLLLSLTKATLLLLIKGQRPLTK